MTGTIDISCGHCGHEAIIPCFIDKCGWKCENCKVVWEVDASGKMEEHLFHYIEGAKFEDKNSGRVHRYLQPFRNFLREWLAKPK